MVLGCRSLSFGGVIGKLDKLAPRAELYKCLNSRFCQVTVRTYDVLLRKELSRMIMAKLIGIYSINFDLDYYKRPARLCTHLYNQTTLVDKPKTTESTKD